MSPPNLEKVLRRESIVVDSDRICGLFLLGTRLLLFIQFLNEPWQALGMGRRGMIFLAEVQVKAEPFLVKAMLPIWDRPVSQLRFKLHLHLRWDGQHGESPVSA